MRPIPKTTIFSAIIMLFMCSPVHSQEQETDGLAPERAKENILTVHYRTWGRSSKKSAGFALWVWQDGEPGTVVPPLREKLNPGFFDYEIKLNNFQKSRPLNILPRTMKSSKTVIWDKPQRCWNAGKALGNEIWLRYGDPKIHKQAPGSRFITRAYAESAASLYVNMVGGTLSAAELRVVGPAGSNIPITRVHAPSPRRQGFKRTGKTITFLYDGAYQGGRLNGDRGIYVAGSFNRWQRAERSSKWRLKWDDSMKVWALTVDAGKIPDNAEFKFKQKGGGWGPTGGNLRVKKTQGLRVDLATAMTFGKRYELCVKGESAGADIVPRGWLHSELGAYSYKGQLGAIYGARQTRFVVFAPTASKVEVLIYQSAVGGTPTVLSLKKSDRYTWEGEQSGDLHRRFYMLRIDAPGTNPIRPVIDPYSRCNTAHDGRGMILNLRMTDPEGFRSHSRPDFLKVTPDAHPNSPEDAVIYEAHVRDFTIDRSSGAKNRGLFLGLIEPGTRGPGGVKTGLDHFLELGVTHVQIMPLQDFDNNEKGSDYNWGYMPSHFNSPEGWYASKKSDESRVRELKEMIHGLHKAGLRMVLDVVYNHTADSSSFDKIVPYYYYRMRSYSDDPYWNGSGCGNEFRSEGAMVRKFILDSIKYWVEEYKVDGFRFDLMGLLDRETMRQIAATAHKIDKSILVYGEPWAGGDTPIQKTEKGSQQGQGFGVFNDTLRDAIKGSNNHGARGFLQNPQGDVIGKIKNGLEGSTNRDAGGFAQSPREVINYVACHDNKTLWDKLAEDKSANPAMRGRMQRLAGAMVILSQGVPFLHGGQDFHRSKGGEHNSYNKPDSVNKIDWGLKAKNKLSFRYHKGLIALRKAHPVFRMSDSRKIAGQRMRYIAAPAGVVAYQLDGQDMAGETWKKAVVIFNAQRSSQTVSLPAGIWAIVVDGRRAGLQRTAKLAGQVKVAGMSTAVLAN
jgi:pullulanase